MITWHKEPNVEQFVRNIPLEPTGRIVTTAVQEDIKSKAALNHGRRTH